MADTGAVGFQGVQGPATTPTAKPTRQPKPVKGPAPFQGPIGLSDVIDQSPADGFALPPTTLTHPNGHNVHDPYALDQNLVRPAGTTAPISAAPSALNTGFAPMDSQFATPFNQQGIKPPEGTAPTDPRFGVTQEQIQSMQATQRAMQIVKIAPNLGRHPDIVAALAYNTAIPFTPETIKLVGAITKARSAMNYAKDFTMEDFNKTARIVEPQAFATNGFWDRLGQGLGKEADIINKPFTMGPGWVQFVTQHFGPLAPYYDTMDSLKIGGKILSPVGGAIEASVKPKKVELPDGITAKALPEGGVEYFNAEGKKLSLTEANDLETKIAGNQLSRATSGGSDIAAVAGAPGSVVINPPKIIKSVGQFLADQFDTPEHMYRYIASVQHKYGFGYAALALAPMVLGAVAGTALGGLGGAEGAELSAAAEEALINLVAREGLPDLAAANLSGQALNDAMQIAETETTRIATAQSAAGTAEKIATPFAKAAMAIPRGISKVATSPTALGADIGFTAGGQGLFRQEYMDSRDGTVWAKKNPKLASTLGRWATEWMPEGGWKTGLSGAIDAAAMVAVPDAIGAIGRVVGIARSAEGFRGGILSAKYSPEETAARQEARAFKYQEQINAAFINGTLDEFLAKELGIKGKIRRSPAWFGNVYDKQVAGRADRYYTTIGGKYRTGTAMTNIDRAYNESPSVRSTVNLIAQLGSADAIISVDPRFAAYADLLAEARVLNADGTVNMTDSVENVKRVFRDSQTAEALMDTSRVMPIGYIPYVGGKARGKIASTIKIVDPNGITRELPAYTDFKELKIENRKFTAGDRNSLPAISSWITFAYGRGVAEQVVNELAKTTDPQVWENVLVNTMTEVNYQMLVGKLVESDLPQIVIDETIKGVKQTVSKTLREIFNFGGPGSKGHYGIGVNGGTQKTITGKEAFGEYYQPVDLSRVQSHIEEITQDLLDHAILSQASKYGMTKEELAATGETLYHGTVADFEGPFDPTKAASGDWRSGAGAKNGGFYFSKDQKIAKGFAKNRRGATGKVITTKVYGKTIDLVPPKIVNRSIDGDFKIDQAWFDGLPNHVQKWLEKRFLTGKRIDVLRERMTDAQIIAEEMQGYGLRYAHETDPQFAKLLQESADKGYGKIRVPDNPDVTGGESIIAHPDFIAHERSSIPNNVMNLEPGNPLVGANQPFTNVEDEAGNSMAAGIVPSDVGKMLLPSYQQMDRISEGLVEILRERFKDVVDTAPKIAELEGKILELQMSLPNISDPAKLAQAQKNIAKTTAQLNIQKQIAALPLDAKKFDETWLQRTASTVGPGALHDTIDHYYNGLWFKSLALLTGGWATRTGMSEAALNIMRQGPLNYSAAKLAASTARQERAVLHIGKKFTREAAQDIAARIYHVVKENEMLRNGQVFESNLEMEAAVANVHRVANETFTNLALTKEEIMKAVADEERNMRGYTMDNAVARYRGTMIGLKRAAVKGLGKDELLDAAIKLMYLNDGHMVSPMLNATHAGVAQDMQVSGTTSEEIDAATYERPLVGSNRGLQEGHLSRIYHSVAGTRARFASDLFYRSHRMVGDEVYHQTIQAYAKVYEQAKLKFVNQAGMSEEEASIAAANEASMQIFNETRDLLDNLPADVRAALIRTRRPLAKDNPLRARNNPDYYKNGDKTDEFLLTPEEEASVDHATAVIKSAEGTFRFLDGTINEKLLNAIAGDKLPEDIGRFKKLFMTDASGKKIEEHNFNSVPGPELDHAKYNVVEKALNATVGKASGFFHRKALGPIVNRLTRDPIYIVDFAAERRLLEPMVKDGQLTRDQADVLAQSRASANAMRYIHNPKNKLKFENMMRAWAPFYFAENQAWRRLGRLALTNPGAAEQYTKLMYAAQDALYQRDQNTNNMSIPIPGTTWLNKWILTPVISTLLTLKTWKFEPTIGTDQGLEFNPSSARSLFPWVTEGGGKPGIGSLLSSFIPAFGPFVTIPAGLYVQRAAGTIPLADEFLAKHVVGDAGMAQSMALSLIAPNPVVANTLRIFAGTVDAGSAGSSQDINSGPLSKVTSSFVAAENMAIVNVLDNEQRNVIEKAKQETAQALKSYKQGSFTADKDKSSFQYFMDLGGTPAGWTALLTLKKMMEIVDPEPKNKGKYQEFRDKVNAQATAIMGQKMFLSGGSPFSVQVGRADPEIHQYWQDLLAKKGSIIDALPEMYKKYPWATAETLFTTQATNAGLTGVKSASGVSYPTTKGVGRWMLDHSQDIHNYSSAMRWVLPSEFEPKPGVQGNDQMAHMLQVSWGLRTQKAPAGFIQTYQDSLFNQFVYGVLQPWGKRLIKNGGFTVTDVNNLLLHNKTTWRNGNKPLENYSLLEQFGKHYAPLAFDDYISAQGATNRNDAMTELIKATNDPAMVKKYPTFGVIKKILLPDAEVLNKTLSNIQPGATWGDTDIPYRDGLAEAWQGRMDEVEAQYPQLKAVVTQLFRPLAPVFTN